MENWTKLLVAFVVLSLAAADFPEALHREWVESRRNACAEVECGTGENCVLGQDGNPKCVCNQVCTAEYKPLCATNGRTYNNLCTMELEACLNGVHLDIIMFKDCKFVFACGGAIIGLALVTVVLLAVLVVRCCRRRRSPRRMAFVIDDYTSDAFFSHSGAIYKPTTTKSKMVAYDKVPILSA